MEGDFKSRFRSFDLDDPMRLRLDPVATSLLGLYATYVFKQPSDMRTARCNGRGH